MNGEIADRVPMRLLELIQEMIELLAGELVVLEQRVDTVAEEAEPIPEKMERIGDIEKNQLPVWEMCTSRLGKFINSSEFLPQQIKEKLSEEVFSDFEKRAFSLRVGWPN
jgi:Rad3-related DNA helicase